MRDSYGLYVDKLQGEYKETFEQIMTYMATQNNDINSEESQMGELLDVFLQAQEEGKPVSKIVGNDLEAFCKNFGSQFGWESKVLHAVDRWKSAAWFIFVFSAVDLFFLVGDYLSGEQVDWFVVDTEFNWTGYILSFLCMGVVFTILDFITTKMMFKYSKKSFAMRALSIVRVLIAIGCVILCVSFLYTEAFQVFQLPLWILCVLSGGYLLLYYAFNRKRVKEKKESKISFWKLAQEEARKDIDGTMQKKFAGKNKWRRRFGRKALSLEEFMELEEKDCKLSEKLKGLCIATPFLICIGMYVADYFETGIENPGELFFCAVFVFIFEAVFMCFWYKIVSVGVGDRMNWIKKEREKLFAEEVDDAR